MAYAPSAIAPAQLSYPEVSRTTHHRRGLLRRLLDALMASRRREVDREIAHYLESVGGKFTDDVEREIECRFLSPRTRW